MSDDSSPSLDITRLRASLPVSGLGEPLIYAPVISSTNTLAMERVAQDTARHGTIVLTDTQPQGRGRQGRGWITLRGRQILLSVILDLPFAPHWIVMAASVAALDALVAVGVSEDRVGIKWPNDILIDERKAAGILIETTAARNGQLAGVVGMGMNVNGSLAPWPEIATRATTLEDALGHPLDRETIVVEYLQSLGMIHTQLAAGAEMAQEHLWERWRKRLVTLGRATTVHQGAQLLTGVAEDVAPDGALILREADGSRTLITWGDVENG